MFFAEKLKNKISWALSVRMEPVLSRWYLNSLYESRNGRMYRKQKAPLTKIEIAEAKKFWGKQYSRGKYETYAFYKSFCNTFDVRYMPNDYYFYAEYVLNPRYAAYFPQHKGCFDLFVPKENFPEVIVRRIDGHYMLGEVEISPNETLAELKKRKSFVFKRARMTGGGQSVEKVVTDDITNLDDYLRRLISVDDFICQEIVDQNTFMASFNPDSVNTIRVLTLMESVRY